MPNNASNPGDVGGVLSVETISWLCCPAGLGGVWVNSDQLQQQFCLHNEEVWILDSLIWRLPPRLAIEFLVCTTSFVRLFQKMFL